MTGGEDGFIKVYDLQFRIIVWFEKLNAGPISSISLSYHSDSIFSNVDFPELIIGTKKAKVLLMQHKDKNMIKVPSTEGTPSQKKTDKFELILESPDVSVLFEGQPDEIRGLSVHPSLPIFAVGGLAGMYLSLFNSNLNL